MAITDDWGATWKTSTPLVGFGNIQPSLVRKKDGTLVAYMRDNGPAPKRLHVSRSRDRGETWSAVEDSTLPNPGIRRRGASRSRTAIGCSSTTISNRAATAWPCRCRRTRARPGRGRGTSSAIRRSCRSAAARRVSLSVDHPGARRHAARHLQLFHPAGRARRRTRRGALIRKAIKHAHFNEQWIRARP